VYDGDPLNANTKIATSTFLVTVGAGNTPPSIPTIIASVTTQQGVPTAVIPFTVADVETALAFLTVTASSTDSALFPTANIQLGGSAGNRTVFLIPAAGRTGTATITLTVTDTGTPPLTGQRQFSVSVIAAPTVAPDDFNNDGRSDLILEDNIGSLVAWFMNKEVQSSAAALTPSGTGDANWRIISSADFNGDGKPDLLFQHNVTGNLAVWSMNGTSMTSPTLTSPASPGQGYKAIDTGDFNGDGKPDILFQHTNGGLAGWYMNGTSLTIPFNVNPENPGQGWGAAAVADINKDGNQDIILQHTDGTVVTWFMNGVDLNSPASFNPPNSGAVWRVVSATDLDGDGNSDLIFRNTQNLSNAVWFLNGLDLISAKVLTPAIPSGTFTIVAP
jgi:hypothetical protein